MTADETKPKLEVVPSEELDEEEEEEEFRRLRRDVPGVKGAGDVGITTISVGKQISPKNEFFRTHSDFRPVVPLVDIEVGMDRQYIAVSPDMVEPLASMGITVTDHTLYLTITPIFRLGFRDKGRLIDSTDHVLVQKWAGRDRR